MKNTDNTLDSVLASVTVLWEKHHDRIRAILETEPSKKMRVSIGVVMDESEAEPLVQTQIRFGTKLSESITARLDDPHQGSFQFVATDAPTREAAGVEEEEPAPPKIGRKK